VILRIVVLGILYLCKWAMMLIGLMKYPIQWQTWLFGALSDGVSGFAVWFARWGSKDG